MRDPLQRVGLRLVAVVVLGAAGFLLLLALLLALAPVLGAAGACALVGAILALGGGGLLLAARRPPPRALPPAPAIHPLASLAAHVAAIAIVRTVNRRV